MPASKLGRRVTSKVAEALAKGHQVFVHVTADSRDIKLIGDVPVWYIVWALKQAHQYEILIRDPECVPEWIIDSEDVGRCKLCHVYKVDKHGTSKLRRLPKCRLSGKPCKFFHGEKDFKALRVKEERKTKRKEKRKKDRRRRR